MNESYFLFFLQSGRASPFSKRGQSPIHKSRGRNPSPNRRPPSPSTDGISPYSPEVTTKKVSSGDDFGYHKDFTVYPIVSSNDNFQCALFLVFECLVPI